MFLNIQKLHKKFNTETSVINSKNKAFKHMKYYKFQKMNNFKF